ncbi:MAG: hypothetical protein IPP48_12290 [Chitinophagaceae bacterium]|nr:hypothetical protein [Chitinophagaceae bacterium]
MLRVLKLYVVVNDKNIYELKEQQPVVIDDQPLPVKLMAKNGYHFSKPLIITSTTAPHILIGVGCEADNGRFWGGIVLSTWLFVIFFLTKLYVVLFFG